MSLWVVEGPHAYRGHAPGEQFEAELEEGEERRAKARGNIRCLRRGPAQFDPDSASPPSGQRATAKAGRKPKVKEQRSG